MDSVTLTRGELYELVWSKPMTAIAEKFGVSSVAFAKYCVKLGVPRPSRGYWQQLAAGLRPQRDKLPKPDPRTQTEITLTRRERLPTKVRDRPKSPDVTVADTLVRPHPVLKQIRERMRPLRPNEHGMSGVRGDGHAVFKVGKQTEKRALRIFDALFKALAARGHQIELRNRFQGDRGRFVLEVTIRQEPVEFWLVEHADRSSHVPTAKELDDHARHGWMTPQKYDFAPSGRLALEATWTREEGLRRRWSESPKQRLEDILGEIVVGLEAIAGALADERRRHEEERRAEQQGRDEQERERRRAARRQALADHLVKTAQRWREAATVRDFLSAMSERVPEGRRSPEFARWFAWAKEYVEQHDPLGEPDRVAQSLEPDRPA